MKKQILILLLLILTGLTAQVRVIKSGDKYYLSSSVIVKIKPSASITDANDVARRLNQLLKTNNIVSSKKVFVDENRLNKSSDSFSRIYELTIASSENPEIFSQKISKLKEIEWAEPRFVRKTTYTPNDPEYLLGSQLHLTRIKATEAWDVSKGNKNIIIGIVDTGIDWNHPDLSANIFVNTKEIPNNGADEDDGGNYPDDIRGWDFGGMNGTPDNNPSEDLSSLERYHGTHVGGIASAVSNNGIGIASIGFNCTLLPVKVSRNDLRDENGNAFIVYGFDGIRYAADKGAKIINCSWGGYGYSIFEQEVIDYAISKGALVVCAAGNDSKSNLFYPASYKGTLSVGWLNRDNDAKSPFGNYGMAVDVMAPGTQIYSTWPVSNGTSSIYKSISGSSMSTPLVSGLAGLVIEKFPNYTPLQISERIRVTSDNIETFNPDSLKYFLGHGRINAYRALTENNIYSVRAAEIKFIDDGNKNGIFQSGESVSIEMNFTNYLNDVGNVSISISSSDQFIHFSNSSFQTGPLKTLNSISNASNKFVFAIDANAPDNYRANFLIRFEGAGYSDYQWTSITINPTYETQNNNKLTFTITSKGAFGFNDYPNNIEGSGLKYLNQDNVLFEGALMYGTGAAKLMDAARQSQEQSNDFKITIPIKMFSPGIYSDEETYSAFNDEGAGDNKLGVSTTLYTYSFTAAPNDSYIILRNHFANTNSQNINNFYCGYYFDFDMPGNDFQDDLVNYDATDNFGYVHDSVGLPQNTFVSVALISHNNYGFYAINQDSSTAEITPNSNGFSDGEKWFSISNGVRKTNAGPADISFVTSAGPFNIEAGKSIDVAFVVAAGSSLDELKTAVKQSRIKWKDIPTSVEEKKSVPLEFALYQNYPNPFNPSTTIKYQIAKPGNVTLKVYDLLGRELAVLVDEFKQPGIYNSQFSILNSQFELLSSGVYFYRLTSGDFQQTKKLVIMK